MVSTNRLDFRINQLFGYLMLICALLVCFMMYHNQFWFKLLNGENYGVSNTKSRDIDINRGTPYLIPGDKILENLSETELMEIYRRYISSIQTPCRNQSRFGSSPATGKAVCLDDGYTPSTPCIVYSFGSTFQFDFDVATHTYLGCDVYTYDPTKDGGGITVPNGVQFSEVGLAGKDYTTDIGWEMRTLQSIFKDNNHEQKTVDIVKIDIEGDEWVSLPNIIETGVHRQIKQILIELHVGRMFGNPNGRFWGNVGVAKQLRALRLLYENGFRLFSTEMDAVSQPSIHSQNEISLINMAFSQY